MEQAGQRLVDRGTALSTREYRGYQPSQRVASLSGNEELASQRAASLSSRYQPALDRANTAYSSGALDKYIDPYRENVIDIGARRINQDYDNQLGALNRKRGMMDAWGSSRGTQLEAALNAQRSRALRENEVTGLSTAFGQANDRFFQDRASNLDAAQTIGTLGNNDIIQLGATGANQRQREQQVADFNYGQFLEQRDWDVNNLAPLIAAIGGAKTGQTSTETTSQSGGGLGQVLGLATSIGGLLVGGAGILPMLGVGGSAAGAGK